MKAELITIGDELLIGQTVDTNASWIGEQLNQLGIDVSQISSIRDDRQHILDYIRTLFFSFTISDINRWIRSY